MVKLADCVLEYYAERDWWVATQVDAGPHDARSRRCEVGAMTAEAMFRHAAEHNDEDTVAILRGWREDVHRRRNKGLHVGPGRTGPLKLPIAWLKPNRHRPPLIQVEGDDGRGCDARCYTALGPRCSCVCGGRNHGQGYEMARENSWAMLPELLADGRVVTICGARHDPNSPQESFADVLAATLDKDTHMGATHPRARSIDAFLATTDPDPILFRGKRDATTCTVTVVRNVDDAGSESTEEITLDYMAGRFPEELGDKDKRYSPSGYEWGYAGSGPHELARALLAEHMGEVPDRTMYHDFCAEVVNAMGKPSWSITRGFMRSWVHQYRLGTLAVD